MVEFTLLPSYTYFFLENINIFLMQKKPYVNKHYFNLKDLTLHSAPHRSQVRMMSM